MTVLVAPSWLRLRLPAALALVVVGSASLLAMPVLQPAKPSLVRLAADSVPPASIRSDNPNDYVQVHDGKLVLGGKPFAIRGTNYFGSWLHHSTIDVGNGFEHANAWSLYHAWDSQKVDADFRFIRSQLRATAVRVGTPGEAEFADLVKYHDYQPWFNPDGTITERYKTELIKLADIAYTNGVRIQFCLLWNVSSEIAKDPDGFKSGGQMDQLYSMQVRSIVTALRNHPGVIGYSIGNEVLVNWPINGTHRSWYEVEAAGFIVRRLQEVRAAAPRQLVTTDEGFAPTAERWYNPGPDFIPLAGVDTGTGVRTIRLADMVDYLGPHFYPETLHPEDLVGGFGGKIEDAKRQLAIYLQAAKALGKPVVINEIGLQMSPETIPISQYSPARDEFFQAIISEGQELGLQGLLAWNAIPEITLLPGHYRVIASKDTPGSPSELDIDLPDHTQERVLFNHPQFHLFEWRDGDTLPGATAAVKAIASAWPDVP
jgi:hypothetical protein